MFASKVSLMIEKRKRKFCSFLNCSYYTCKRVWVCVFFFRENIYVKSFDVRKPSSTNFRKPNLSSAQTEEFQLRFNITHWQEACLTTEHWKIKCSRAFFCAKEAQLTDISLTTKLITSICEEAYKVICLSKDHWVH